MGKRPLSSNPIASSPGASCSGGRLRPGPPPRKSFISMTGDTMDNGRNERRSSKDGGGYFSDILPDDDIAHDAGYEADVEIVKPYAIEEPDEETDRTPTSVATPKLLEATDQWQNELVNSLRGLYCDSDSTDTPPLIRHKRGRKRKPDTSVTVAQSFPSLQPSKDRDVEMGVGSTVFSSKRQRRKSTKIGEDLKMSHSNLLADDDVDNTGAASHPAALTGTSRNDGRQKSPLKYGIPAMDWMDVD